MQPSKIIPDFFSPCRNYNHQEKPMHKGVPELDHNSRFLNDIANLFSLHQLIDEPTWVSLTSSTLIDLIFTNCPDRVSCSGVYPTTISDHSLVYAYRKLSIGVQSRNHSTVTYKRFKNFDPTKFRNDICSQDWDMWYGWKNIFLGIVFPRYCW